MGALDVLVQAAVTALVDVAVLVDHRVVAHVAPAQRLGVVVVHAANDAGGLRLGVVVRAGGVVDRGRLHRIVVGGVAAAAVLVRAPARTGDHARHAGQVLRVDDRVDAVALLDVAVDEDRFDVVERHLVVDGFDVAPGGQVVDGDAVGARRLLDVAGARVGGPFADLVRLSFFARRTQAARAAGNPGAVGRTGGRVVGRSPVFGAAGDVAGVGIAGGAGAARAEVVLETAALLVGEVGGTLDVVDGHAGAGAEHVEAVGGDLHGGGRLDEDELGAVETVALALGGVVRFSAVPLRPRAVGTQCAEVAGHVRRAGPGQREHGEFLVAAQFLDDAAVGVQLVGDGLGGDGRVFHEHGRARGQGDLVDEDVDRPAAVVLDEFDGRGAAEGDQRRGDERGHDAEDQRLPRT